MSQTESSALIRFINSAANQPILDTVSAFEEPSAFGSTSEIMTDSFSRPSPKGTLKWVASGVVLLGVGLGLSVLLMKLGGQGSTNTTAPTQAAPTAVAAAPAAPRAFLTAPAAAPTIAVPAAAPAAPPPTGQTPSALAASPAAAAADSDAAPTPTLTPIPVERVTGRLLSEPPGARITVVDGSNVVHTVTAPAELELQVGSTYQLLFEKTGYATAARAVAPTKDTPVRVVVMLERSVTPAVAATPTPVKKVARRAPAKRSRKVATRTRSRARRAVKKRKVIKSSKTSKGAKGVLMVGARPPCEIHINGRRTGLTTPQRGIKLRPGSYRITLVNREHRIRSTSRVVVKSGKKARLIRNLTRQMRGR